MKDAKPLTGAQRDAADIARGALVNLLGIASSSLGFVFFVILGRLYGSGATGQYILSWTTVDLASKICILGLDRAILSRAARRRAEDDADGARRTLGTALAIGAISTAVVLAGLQIAAGAIADAFYGKPQLATSVRCMAICLPFWTISALFLHAARAARVMRYEVFTKRLVEPVVLVALAALFYRLGFGESGLYAAFAASTAAGAIFSVFLYSRMFPLCGLFAGVRFNAEAKSLLGFSAPIGLYDLLNQLMQRVDLFAVGRLFPAAAAGVYGMAQESSFFVKKIRQAFDPILIPVISGASQKRDFAGMSAHYKRVFGVILTFNLAALGAVLLAGGTILSLFGEKFSSGAAVFSVLTFAAAANGAFGLSELFILVERPMINLLNSALATVISIALAWTLASRFGVIGAAYAAAATFVIMNAARIIETRAITGLHPFGTNNLVVALCAAGALCPAFIFSAFAPLAKTPKEIASAFIFLSLYAASLLLTKRIKKIKPSQI